VRKPPVPDYPEEIVARAKRVRLVLLDVDGVMTDGRLLVHSDGSESKHFHIRDGSAIVCAHQAGLMTGLVSARQSAATAARASQLGIGIVVQGGSKLEAYEGILRGERLSDQEVAYMGDDLLDLPVISRVGLSAAPADASEEVLSRVHWVAGLGGGRGAVRELIELILRAQQHWDSLVRTYAQEGGR
jgi:3-deoxy-D-manno-octulosonate 8-phosphate phosphatase (KDO 8-P phosphatase)